jgi:hypothetical protein
VHLGSRLGLITALDLKQWLHRCISEYGRGHEENAEQTSKDRYHRGSAAALDGLATHVLMLPDDDERLTRFAAALPKRWAPNDDLPILPSLESRLAGFGPDDDPDQLITDYIETELQAARSHGGF